MIKRLSIKQLRNIIWGHNHNLSPAWPFSVEDCEYELKRRGYYEKVEF